MANINISGTFRDYSLDDWLKVLLESKDKSTIKGCTFPKYSHRAMLGSATLESGLEEAGNFYRLGEKYINSLEKENSRYLDFGCGVGRIFRLFMKDFKAENMHGIDPSEEYIQICRNDFPDPFRFSHINLRPPTEIASNSVDLITAYSVFSHFSCIQATRWLEEFQRITRPGAILLLTTYGKGHIEYIDGSEIGKLSPGHQAQKKHINLIGGKDEIYRMFDLGEMIFFFGGGTFGQYDYGHAYLGEKFIHRVWGQYFKIEDIIDDYSQLEQIYVILRKKS
jgi:SAM-dependent methyltransferase